jgi:hypothetical protein
LGARLRRDAARHEIVPRLGAVLGAPHRLGFFDRIGREYRPQEGVDRDVIQLHHFLLQLAAKTAVGVLEGVEHALAVPAHALHRVVRRFPERLGVELGAALAREVALGAGPHVHEVAEKDEIQLLVGVGDLAVEHHLVDARERRARDAFHGRVGKSRLESLPDRRFTGARGPGREPRHDQEHCRDLS